ncbi:hypothetical protein VNO80_19613 [Phaseolus coccineus]|uniref:Uncharacterized protein n=1 Tax=Phaseolus coccineus TaxID=3886 RepID=A0AAN9QXI5_PHACN
MWFGVSRNPTWRAQMVLDLVILRWGASVGLRLRVEVQGAVQASAALVCLSGAYVIGFGVSKTWVGAAVLA